jgi:hypothetical protein
MYSWLDQVAAEALEALPTVVAEAVVELVQWFPLLVFFSPQALTP